MGQTLFALFFFMFSIGVPGPGAQVRPFPGAGQAERGQGYPGRHAEGGVRHHRRAEQVEKARRPGPHQVSIKYLGLWYP